MGEAIAALATPIGGRPKAPWISAGVSSRLTPVDNASVHIGVTASPTPRRIDVDNRNTKNSGVETIMICA